jgi:energy-coupling factor transporter ATP-binding protein EcfA2
MFVEAAEGLAAAASVYGERHVILAAFRKIGIYLIRGNTNVAVFGPGGTGKSTLGLFMNGNLESDSPAKSYQETISNAEFRLDGDIPGKVIVPPGQDRRRPGNWDELFSQITSGDITRVIHIVSWGHHSTMLERSRLDSFGTTSPAFETAYLEDGRNREIESLRQIVPHLKSAPGRLHMLTVVLKQDLWWNDRLTVRDYYESGSYADLLQEIRDYKGTSHFHHDTVSAALVQQNLKTADGFNIASTTAGYDDLLRTGNLGGLVAAIRDLIQ